MDIGKIFKELVWDQLVKLALTKLFAAIPFLGWGPIGIVVSWAVGWVAGYIYDAVELFINLKLIVFKNQKLAKAYGEASVNLRTIGETNGIESEEFKAAREKHKTALGNLISLGG